MVNKIFSSTPVAVDKGLAIVRITAGLLMAYHGLEVFDRNLMAEYANWDVVKVLPAPEFMVYLGKGLEFGTGLLLFLGLATRLSGLLIMANMLFICFFIGNGKFWYGDQHPFLFALIGFLFFMTGPGAWSLKVKK